MNPPPTSLRSIQSNKSGKSGSNRDNDEDFELCLNELRAKFHCPVAVTVHKEYQQNRDNKIKTREGKTKSKRILITPSRTEDQASESTSTEELFELEPHAEITLAIRAIYDTQHRLSEILIAKFRQEIIPRIITQFLGLILPNYQQLNKFTIKYCHIDKYTVYELSKALPLTTITDVCLDDCPVKEANYELLLKSPTIKHLSLCRCNINDAVCEQLASKLHFLESAENLVTLNLTSNFIGDEGAKYFAEALRSNRHLRYLNLADNLISDEGASLIFKKFIEFPLTPDEDLNRRRRYMVYLKKKQEIYMEYLRTLGQTQTQKSPSGSRASKAHSTNSKIKTNIQAVLSPRKSVQIKRRSLTKRESVRSQSLNEDSVPIKANMVANELVGPFVDPFVPSSVRVEDGTPHCIGNFELCYLNIAYNDLTYASVKTLLSVVEYQEIYHPPSARGLMKVVLDGNYLPMDCTELITIQNILNKNMKKSIKK